MSADQVSCFAIPLACAFEGLRRQYGLILAFGLFLAYYTLFSLGLSMGEAGSFAPLVGLWLPNAAFLLLGLLGLHLAAREHSLHVMEWLRHLDIRPWRRA